MPGIFSRVARFCKLVLPAMYRTQILAGSCGATHLPAAAVALEHYLLLQPLEVVGVLFNKRHSGEQNFTHEW